MTDRPEKITFGEMRDMGVRGLLVYCADYRWSLRQARRRREAGFRLRQVAEGNDGLPLAAVASALVGGRPQANE
jgi:hypothetical protein